MAKELTPESGREDGNFPWLRIPSSDVAQLSGWPNPHGYSDSDLELRSDLGVRPGESDPGRMLCGVLLIVALVVIVGLVWLLV